MYSFEKAIIQQKKYKKYNSSSPPYTPQTLKACHETNQLVQEVKTCYSLRAH